MSAELRIIAGRWRGRKIQFDAVQGLRPTGDRIRETLFNWLQADIAGASCLDLFAGSGSLGFEAASRGAKVVSMVEIHHPTVKNLQAQIARLQAENISVWQGAAFEYLQRFDYEFDVIFLDPPFQTDLLPAVLPRLMAGHNLKAGGVIYCEYPIGAEPELTPDWYFKRQKKTGAVGYGLIARE